MAKATYWQRGESIDYKNAGDSKIEAGTIVAVGDLIGVAGCDIAPGDVGSLHITGVFKVGKNSGSALDFGAAVKIDTSTGKAAAAGAGETATAVVIEAAASAATEVLVKINACTVAVAAASSGTE